MKKDDFEKEFENASPIEMNFSDISNKIDYDKYTGNVVATKQKRSPFVWLIPSLVACLAIGIILPITLNSVLKGNNYDSARLTTPTSKKIVTTRNNKLSKTTFDSYNTFTKNFVSLCFDESIKQYGEKSLGVSIPDAYIAFAITAITSNENVQNEFLTYMGLNSIYDLKISTKEILSTLCTLTKDNKGYLSGGYNLNSIWLNPKKTILKEKDAELYKDLEDIFDASVYNRALTSKAANDYLKKNGLKDKPTPEIKLDDNDPSATANMSVFYCFDNFVEGRDYYKSQYDSKKHKMEYTFNGNRKNVDYIKTEQTWEVYEGENFVGSNATINNLNVSYYLPEEEIQPSNILSDVLDKNYTYKEWIDEQSNTRTDFEVTINQPYFKLDNKINLDQNALSSSFSSSIEQGGVNERLVQGKDDSIHLSKIIQQSIMTFDYNGFYSCSVTIIQSDTGEPAFSRNKYTLDLNHPYLFSVNRNSLNVDNKFYDIPMVIGEIIDPAYE